MSMSIRVNNVGSVCLYVLDSCFIIILINALITLIKTDKTHFKWYSKYKTRPK